MAKITKSKRQTNERDQISIKTKPDPLNQKKIFKWWKARSKSELKEQCLSTVAVLKEQQQFRYRQAGVFARLYGNKPLYNYIGSGINKIQSQQNLSGDRPTMNVIQSCVDTLTSRVTQSRPRPVFLTDNGDYKERNLAKKLNGFIMGEFYQTKAYEIGEQVLRDAEVLGTGCFKIFEKDKKACLQRKLVTDLLVDPNDALLGSPRQMFELLLIDRDVLSEYFPKYRSDIAKAEQAYPDTGADSEKTIADQVIVAECWHLPSSEDAGDGRHVIVCTEGVIYDSNDEEEGFTKKTFPFVFLHYSPSIAGFWGQGIPEQLMGTQVEINKLLFQISKSINLVGVPRIFVEDGSKVMKTAFNNEVGSIITYRGTPPVYSVAPCVPGEMYEQLQRLINYAYQQSGVSALSASAQKPAGLNSGEAIRNFDDLQSDRFASLVRRFDNMYVDLAYQVIDLAKDICKREGKYETVYPNKNGTKQIDLPKMDMLNDPFVIQCFDSSSLPRDPAGRLQKVTEMMQAGILDIPEGRRLLDFPDLEQVERLANASEERILQILDDIVESGKYTPPDPFMDLALATKLVTQYYNLYSQAKLEEAKAQKLRDFYTQIMALKAEAMQATQPQMGAPGAAPTGVAEAPPTNPMIPNAPGQIPAA